MESGSDVTDKLQLPSSCTCGGRPVPRTYEQLLRIRRNCLSAVYTIKRFTGISGDCTLNKYIQLNDGGNPRAIVTIQNCDPANIQITVVNTPVYIRQLKNPVSSVILDTGAPGPEFTIEYASSSCCKCN